MRSNTVLSALLLAGLLCAACSLEEYEDYYREPYSSPGALVSAFTSIWEEGDLTDYGRRLLYDPAEVTRDGRRYAGFGFYFPGELEEYGLSWEREAELSHAEALLSGEPSAGGEAGGVEAVQLDLALDGEWEYVGGATIEGDLSPSGTLRGTLQVDLRLDLDDAGGGPGGYEVSGTADFYLIPVDGLNGPGYRLWKWMDHTAGGSGPSWTTLKILW